jgi:hypothetical protein
MFVDNQIKKLERNIKDEMELNGYPNEEDILYRAIASFDEDYAKRYGISVSKTNDNNLVMLKKD